MPDKTPTRRCAIYVRKSSEEGLDMSYNSLEAQTDACAAYIASQKHEGWTKLLKVYEDGGYSGGNMDRPGLKALMVDVEAGLVDIIVVYKIDRLTRSLTDFAKLNEVLDRNEVSFVAVTQQFNTSTSMGRLTLNVLLSFAQFEREVSGERIRDKVAASKRKGMWMGGPVPLGFAVDDRKLVIVPAEAKIVQAMFARYLELHSVHLLQRELQEQGVRTRVRVLKGAQITGGCPLGRGAISHMLKNPLYVGKIRYKGELHNGQHEAIIDQNTFDAVQVSLARYSPGEAARVKRPTGALLQGLLFDDKGERLIPTHANKKGARYHYYTSAKRLKSAADDPDGLRVPAGDLERVVVNAVAERLRDHAAISKWADEQSMVDRVRILARCSEIAALISSEDSAVATKLLELIQKVELSKTSMNIQISNVKMMASLGGVQSPGTRDDSAKGRCTSLDIVISSHLLRCGKQVKLVLGTPTHEPRNANEKLVEIIAKPRRWYEGLISGKYPSLRAISNEENLDKSYVRRLLSLAFLAPDIVERILTGDHAATLTPERLRKACPLPIRWEDQRAMLID